MQHNLTNTTSTTEATRLPQTAAVSQRLVTPDAFDETSLAHFCTFIDFYTRSCHDPFSTSLTCAKQAETVQITPEDLTPETVQQVLTTMLSVVDHLEKKWLDEQIRHEERMQRHREDVARLSQQLRLIQPQSPVKTPLLRRGIAWLHQVVGWPKVTLARHPSRKIGLKRRQVFAA
jgi:hypothetical protein